MATKTRLQSAVELMRQGRLAEARAKLLKEVRLAPQSGAALGLLGAVTFEAGKHDEAIGYLRQAARLSPSAPGPALNLGKALLEGRRPHAAAETLKDVVGRWPEMAEARFSYGNALMVLARHEQAAEEYRAAIRLSPSHIGAHANLALVLMTLQDHAAALSICERLVELAPDSATGQLLSTMARQMLCLWDGRETRLAQAARLLQQGHTALGMGFVGLLLWDDAGLHRRCAELETGLFAKGTAAAPVKPSIRPSSAAGGKIRVAYVSADFRCHPMGRLTAALIEGHDRDRFETIGVSLGKDDKSAERQRLIEAFDRFLDVSADARVGAGDSGDDRADRSSADAIIAALRALDIDIAVDLMGHTHSAKPSIYLRRVAPVQVNYLGYPGTTAIDAMDYVVVDPFIAAGTLRETASEKLAILPDCYQCNDGLAPTPADPPSRSSCGLPEQGLVLCCFNDAKKITPEVFDLWMRILREVHGSVLWLLKPWSGADATLRNEAGRRGVDPARLIFADRVGYEAHVARNGVPDLHLDTFPYNAHTTATDALRAGCPILTRAGTSFPARVCGSLLTTIGVPELITDSAEDYEALALRLARDRALLADLRRRIEQGRAASPLFDPSRFCRNIERAYTAMVARSRAGEPPEELDVRTLTGAPSGGLGPNP
jgi:protein O-GlcNAc transferase